MQNDPPPGDSPAPQGQSPNDGPTSADPQPPTDEQPSAGSAQGPTASPRSDLAFDLNIGLDAASHLYTSDASAGVGSSAADFASPLEKQIKEARAQFRRQPGREPFFQWDPLTRYERGIKILLDRIPAQHPKLGDVSTLCRRLQENIDYTRVYGTTPTLEATRSEILGSLDNQTLVIFQITFTRLYQINGSGGKGDTADGQELPKTQRDVADWYTQLFGLERCYVIAACVLQGAPSHEVSRAAHELHQLIEQARPVVQRAPNDERSGHGAMEPDFISAEDLLVHTHSVAHKIEGAERIMWRDEAFDTLVREFLARQATTVGMRFAEHDLLDILQGWAVSDDEERSFRAARVLADLWWRQHQDKLLDLAETWAASDEPQIWQGGAALLYGAYVAERAERPGTKDADSIVLRRLHEWSDWRDDDAGFALVATYAYGLLGRQWPEVALDGLDYLLCLGAKARKHNTTPPLSILFLAMLSYVEMASAGQIRPLLKRFASHAEYYTLDAPAQSHSLLEPAQSLGARQRSLEMLFFHFVFLAALSISGVRSGGNAHVPYLIDVGLPPRPDMPSARGQDVLLAGLLSNQEAEWRASVQTLLCAAISTGRQQLAFDLLASWIHIVTFEPRVAALETLCRVVCDLHRQLSDWDKRLRKGGLRAGSGALEQRLHVWSKATRDDVLRPFALRTLDALKR